MSQEETIMPPPANSTRRLAHRVTWELLLGILLAIAVVSGSFLNKEFLSVSNWTNLLADFVEIALMALALSLIIITGEIDLSVASVLGLSSALLGLLWQHHVAMPVAIVICLLAGLICGTINGFLIVRFRLPSLAVTIGTLGLFRGVAYIVLGDQAVADFPAACIAFGIGIVPHTFIPLPFGIFIILAVLFWVLLHHSTLGRNLYAIGGNPMAALFSGVNLARLKMGLFMTSGVMSALAGIIYTFRFSSARADNGAGFELNAIAAVFLGGVAVQGGKGTITGVVLSLVLIGVINNVLTLADVSNEILRIVTGSLLILSVLLPNLIASGRERWRLRQRQSQIAKLDTLSAADRTA